MPVKRNFDRLDVEEADRTFEAIRGISEEAFGYYFSYHALNPDAHPMEVPGPLADLLDRLQNNPGGANAASSLLLDTYARLFTALTMLAEMSNAGTVTE